MAKVAINGLGRIGRAAFKVIMDTPELELVGVNDIAPIDTIEYLLKYDSVYGRYNRALSVDGDKFVVDGHEVPYFSERDPEQLPWGDLGVDVVFECTGIFTNMEGLQKHANAGARFVILSAPAKGAEVGTVVHGVNDAGDANILSCASCTTNSIAPVMEILNRRVGVKKALMTTVHSYTSTQSLVDSPQKKKRRGRAAALNIVPTSTGAAIATTKALPELEGRFDGTALRVPTPVGSVSDITLVTERPVTVEELNNIFREEAQSDRYKGVMAVSEDEIVSSDIVMDPHAAVVDLTSTQVVDGDLVKIMSWYDNEWGYTNNMINEALSLIGVRERVY